MTAKQQEFRLLDRDELILGMSLPGHLYDDQGRILVHGGQTFTQQHLKQLGSRVIIGLYVGSEWGDAPPPADETTFSPADVVEELFLRHATSQTKSNERANERHQWSVPLVIEVEEHAQFGPIIRKLEVATVDISVGGFSFIFRQYLAPGTCVRARFQSLPSKPLLSGVVQNCRLLGGNQHRIGVRFVEAKQANGTIAQGKKPPHGR